jgi:hypothetical protein
MLKPPAVLEPAAFRAVVEAAAVIEDDDRGGHGGVTALELDCPVCAHDDRSRLSWHSGCLLELCCFEATGELAAAGVPVGAGGELLAQAELLVGEADAVRARCRASVFLAATHQVLASS